jgi:hypothetical protein
VLGRFARQGVVHEAAAVESRVHYGSRQRHHLRKKARGDTTPAAEACESLWRAWFWRPTTSKGNNTTAPAAACLRSLSLRARPPHRVVERLLVSRPAAAQRVRHRPQARRQRARRRVRAVQPEPLAQRRRKPFLARRRAVAAPARCGRQGRWRRGCGRRRRAEHERAAVGGAQHHLREFAGQGQRHIQTNTKKKKKEEEEEEEE